MYGNTKSWNSNATKQMYYPMPAVTLEGGNYQATIIVELNTMELVIQAGSNRNLINAYIVLEYTKTTDPTPSL